MIVVDTSAIIAMLLGEAEAVQYGELLAAAPDIRISAVTDYETRVVLRSHGRAMIERYDALLAEIGISVVSFDQQHSRLAFEGYRRWGKGVHPAALNLGDCAALRPRQEPRRALLFQRQRLLEDGRPARAIATSSPRT